MLPIELHFIKEGFLTPKNQEGKSQNNIYKVTLRNLKTCFFFFLLYCTTMEPLQRSALDQRPAWEPLAQCVIDLGYSLWHSGK